MRLVIEQDIEYLAQQSSGNLNMILSGMTSLMNDTDAKVEALESQGWFKRMVKTVTGKNKATKEEIRRNNEKMNAYMAEAISELYKRECIDEEIIISLGNQINELYAEHIQLKHMLGAFVNKLNKKIDSVDNFHMLTTEIEQGVFSEMPSLLAICKVVSQYDNRILKDDRKLDILRRALLAQEVISTGNISLFDIFMSVISIPDDEIGLVYMELKTYSTNYLAENIVEVIESYYYLPEMKKKMVSKDDFVNGLLEGLALDGNAVFSVESLYDSFIESKLEVLDNLEVTLSEEENREEKEAEELFKNFELEKALNMFYREAEKGNGRAMYFLGEYHMNGYANVEIDKEKALMWRKKGYEANNELASLNYVLMFDDEELKNEVLGFAVSKIEKDAEEGDIFSQSELSWLYKAGIGVETNSEKSFYWVKKAAESEYWLAEYELGVCYKDGRGCEKNEEQAYNWILKPAEKGFPIAQRTVGYFFDCGIGVEQNNEKALEWYKRAVEQGDAISAWNIGVMYHNNDNIERALLYYKKAAELGHLKAQKYLGEFYQKEHNNIERNYSESAKWYGMAAEQNDPKALYEYGWAVFCGYGVNPNEEKGLELMRKSAHLEYIDAQRQVAEILLNASYDFIPRDQDTIDEGIELLEKAVRSGDAYSVSSLGLYYRTGLSWTDSVKDVSKAIKLYNDAIDSGISIGYQLLAECYEKGEGVEKDLNEALRLYKLAVQTGSDFNYKIEELERML